jgi:DnaJ-class molecular chaperone
MAAEFKDYYKILGVNKSADQKEIQKAFRKLARKHHPDVNPGDRASEDQFKEINEANEVLSDPEKRKEYDRMSAYYQQYGRMPGAGGQGAPGGGGHYYTMNEEDLADIFGGGSPFSDFFQVNFGGMGGMGGASQRARRAYTPPAQDAESSIEIELAEAYSGGTRTLEMSEPDGSTRRLEVKIPAGVKDGARIRIAGQGVQGAGGRGDLYLRVRIKADRRFTREGSTLHTKIDVPLATAMLGGEIHVPTPDGRRLALRIPESTANGKSIRLRGQGMPLVGHEDGKGDLYAEVNVVLPTDLSEEQRRRFQDFAASLEGSERKEKVAHG